VVDSEDVNAYLREASGEDFTAKDFRTWAGTVLAALTLRATPRFDSPAQGRRHVVRAVEQVARELGNTPAVCRKCYIHPTVIESYLDGRLGDALGGPAPRRASGAGHALRPEERAVLRLLEGARRPARAA